MLALSHKREIKAQELEKHCHLEVVFKDTRNKGTGMFLSLFSQKPYTISKYYTLRAEHRLSEIMRRRIIDIVHIDHLHMAAYGKFLKAHWRVPVVLREHNVENVIWERLYQVQNNPLAKAYAFSQYRKIKGYEKLMCQSLDRILAITMDDQKRIMLLDPSIKVSVIPAGVDTDYFYPQAAPEEHHAITFVGSMDWRANIDGVLWFVDKVLPAIHNKYPQMKLCLVGSNPAKKIRMLRNSFIDVRPNVPDVREYMAKAEILIVPLRVGGGMRIKILEALAMKKAVISTSIGCEGIDVKHGEDVLVADSEEEFIKSISLLIENRDYRQRLGIQGCNTIQKKYSWEAIAKSIESNYEDVISEYQMKNGIS